MATSRFPFVVVDQTSGPRISFSSEFLLDESEFISICPNPEKERQEDEQRARAMAKAKKATEFEFLQSGNSTNMLPADELFCKGKLLPFPDQASEMIKLNRIITLKPKSHAAEDDVAVGGTHGKKKMVMIDKKEVEEENKNRMNWFIDDDPSPRPPKCTVLWKELLRLKKQRGSSSPALSTSSSSSSSKASLSGDERKEVTANNNNDKKSGERTRRGIIRIRPPVINVQPICSQTRNTVLSPMNIPMRKKLGR